MKQITTRILVVLALLSMAWPASAKYLGDYAVGTDNICTIVNFYQPSTGAAFALASGAVDVYKDDSDTQDNDSGLTIAAWDSLTGAYQVCVDTSSDGTFYSAGSIFTVLISVGTVDSVSVVGTELLTFSLAKGSAFTRLGAPAGASVSADIAAIEDQTDEIGAAGVGLTAADDVVVGLVDDIGVAGAGLTAIPDVDTLLEALVVLGAEQTADSGTTTTIVDAALTQASNDWFRGAGVAFTSGGLLGQQACVTSFTAASDTVTFTPAVTTAVTTNTYYILANPSFCQGGDAFTRLGAPAGASIAADIQAVEDETDDIGVAGAGLSALPDVDTLLEAQVILGAEQTADSGTTTTVVDAALTQATNDWFKGAGIHFTSGTLLGQDACVTGFTAASDTLTFSPAVTTAVTTHTYYLLPDSECFVASGGSGATAQEVWEYSTRILTALDEDTTTLDLNATTIGTAAAVTTLSANAITDAAFDTTAGRMSALGIIDQGTAQSVDATHLQLRAAAAFADDEILGATCVITGGTLGIGQSRTVTDYVSSTDTATVATWTTTPTGTTTYKCFGTAASSGGAGGDDAATIWAYGARTLTSLDEDVTTLDLNATQVGGVAVFDEDTTTIDINATTLGTVTTATNVTTVNGLAANVLTAASAAADLGTELGTAAWATTTRALTELDEDNTTLDINGTTLGTVTTATNVTTVNGLAANVVTAASAASDLTTELQAGLATAAALTVVDDFVDTEITALMNARTQIFPGGVDTDSVLTADSGDTDTLVDAELTFSSANDIDGVYVVRSDGQRCFVESFTPATDTIEFGSCAFTGAWSTQTYKLYPANTQ